jgi:hypothetical protein
MLGCATIIVRPYRVSDVVVLQPCDRAPGTFCVHSFLCIVSVAINSITIRAARPDSMCTGVTACGCQCFRHCNGLWLNPTLRLVERFGADQRSPVTSRLCAH